MSDLKVILFEDPTPLYVLGGLVEIIALVVLFRLRTRRALRFAAVPLAVIALLAVTAALVTTETERLTATFDRFIAAVRDGDMAVVTDLIDDTYTDGRYTKANVVVKLDQTRRRVGLTDVSLTGTEMHIFDTEAIVTFGAIIRVSHPAAVYDVFPTRWQVWWIRRPAGWRVTSSRLNDPGDIPGAPMGR